VGAGPIPLQALHRAEQLWLNQTAEAERPRAFACLWAAKEAYGKWAGTGLVEPDRLAILPNAAGGWSPAGAADAHIETRLVVRDGVELALAVATAA
jgi:phosphopantetheinyl transferase